MLGVLRALQHFSHQVAGLPILIATDNSTVVSHLRHVGGMRLEMMMSLTREIFHLAESLEIVLLVRHIPEKMNCVADALSRRGFIVATEWCLCPLVFRMICRVWIQHPGETIDFFATRFNARTPMFVSPFPDQKAVAVDAMSISWSALSLFAFPPTAMILLILAKVMTDRATLTLVAPLYRKATWFHTRLSLAIDIPRRLPDREDLLAQPWHGPWLVDPRRVLDLHVWRLSGDCIAAADFLRTLLWSQLEPSEDLPLTVTSLNGDFSLVGAVDGRWIHSIPLADL